MIRNYKKHNQYSIYYVFLISSVSVLLFNIYIRQNLNQLELIKKDAYTYSESLKNYFIYFNKNLDLSTANSSSFKQKYFKIKLQRMQKKILQDNHMSNWLINILLKNKLENFVNKKKVEHRNILKNIDNYISKLESELFFFLQIFNVFFIVFPFLFRRKYLKAHADKKFLLDVTFFDLDTKTIVIGRYLLQILKSNDKEVLSELILEINESLINIEQDIAKGERSFLIPLKVLNIHSEMINLKLTVAGVIGKKIMFIAIDNTKNIKKFKYEFDYFKESKTAMAILDSRIFISLNDSFSRLINNTTSRMSGACLDHFCVDQTAIRIKNKTQVWEINLIFDAFYNRQIICSCSLPYFLGGEEKTLFSVVHTFEYNPETVLLLEYEEVVIYDKKLEKLFKAIMYCDNRLSVQKIIEDLKIGLLEENLSLLYALNSLEQAIHKEKWEDAFVRFFRYLEKRDSSSGQILKEKKKLVRQEAISIS